MAHMTGIFRLGRDAEVRYTQNGDAVCSLSLAYSYGRKGDDGKKPTQWVDATLWGKRAESLSSYLTKGSLIYACISEIHIEEFEGKNGHGVKLAGRIDDLEFAGGNSGEQPQQQQRRPQQRPAPKPRQQAAESDFDDDIPF